MGYACRILADSISPAGHRMTSWEVTFPRIVLAEMNTHCVLSRNSASSRAIPVAKRITAIEADPFVPEAFGRNQKGMQPGEALGGSEAASADNMWRSAMRYMLTHAKHLAELGVHKQYANRLLEPFSWHTAVISATDVGNLFHLRINPMAQGELNRAVEMMRDTRNASEPVACDYDDWHTPYVGVDEVILLEEKDIDVAAVSATRCARLSYLTQNDPRDIADELSRYASLVSDGHMSPLEHPARPMTEFELLVTRTFDISLDNGPALRSGGWSGPLGNSPSVGGKVFAGDKEWTVTAVRGPLHYSGKLNGWISRRAHVPGEHDILGYRANAL